MKRTRRTLEEIRTLLDVSAGRRPADLYLDGGTLLNVYSGELYPANVAIAGQRIVYVGSGHAMAGSETRVLRLPGKILAPGYIDPHTHITGMTTPVDFAREVLRTGTTTLVADTLHILLQTPRADPRASGGSLSDARPHPLVPPAPRRLPPARGEGVLSRPAPGGSSTWTRSAPSAR